jgi:hypothetical protein
VLWVHLPYYRDQRPAVVNMDLKFHKRRVIYSQAELLLTYQDGLYCVLLDNYCVDVSIMKSTANEMCFCNSWELSLELCGRDM